MAGMVAAIGAFVGLESLEQRADGGLQVAHGAADRLAQQHLKLGK